jgi:putative tryptophan/tyrosine transport system substrate-binding protein
MRRGDIVKLMKLSLVSSLFLCLASQGHGAAQLAQTKKKILVISSYHREYRWSQETAQGFCDAMLKYGYFDNSNQIAEFTKNDSIETSRVIVKKLWMDAKRKSSKSEMEEMSLRIYGIARQFDPDLIFLGDDDAVNYIGSKFLDAEVPIVFWGVNNTPVKYGLVATTSRPGHNVTGVYQSGYYAESLQLLKKIVPRARTFAIFSDDTSTGRSHYKAIEYLARKGTLPLKLVETVSTNDFELWKSKALELQKKVDAFFIAHYGGLKDREGSYVRPEVVSRWYGEHITIPEAVQQRQFVEEGMLCGADDSGYNQAFEAVIIAHDILSKGTHPSTYPPRTPKRGALMVNTKRAVALGITLTPEMGIDKYIDGGVD